MNSKNLVVGVGVIIAVAILYTLITVVFAEINPIAVLAAVGVAFTGFVWFKKTVKDA